MPRFERRWRAPALKFTLGKLWKINYHWMKEIEKNKPWMKGFGKLSHLHDETQRIELLIQEEFETVDKEGWK